MRSVLQPVTYLASPVALAAVMCAAVVLVLAARNFATQRSDFTPAHNCHYLICNFAIAAFVLSVGLALDRVMRMPFGFDTAHNAGAPAVQPSTAGWAVLAGLAMVALVSVMPFVAAAGIAARDVMHARTSHR